MKIPNMNISREDAAIIDQILARAKREFEGVAFDALTLSMDLTACHLNGCELRLQDLLNAPAGDFMHDIAGITRHMDRRTGKLSGNFEPRYSRYIDMTPTWAAVLPIHILALEQGTEAGKAAAKKELLRLANAVDQINLEKQKDITLRLIDILKEADAQGLDLTDLMERAMDGFEAAKELQGKEEETEQEREDRLDREMADKDMPGGFN